MKKFYSFLAMHLALIQVFANSHVPGQFLIQLKPEISLYQASHIWSSLPIEPLKNEVVSKPWKIILLDFGTGKDETAIYDYLRARPEIQVVQFNHVMEERFTEPDDTHYQNGNMWDMHNTGQNGGTNDADIDAPEAWTLSTGGLTVEGDTIVVSVVDGAFNLAHQDISFQKNYAEIAGNSIDDDNNGFVDDYDGWNFVGNNNNVNTTTNTHATHVSGTVGAKGNNGTGVAGVNWNVKIFPVRGSTGNESVAVAAYSYVYEMRRKYNLTSGDSGLFIVSTNSSFGVNNGDPANFPIWCALYDSLGHVGILSAGATANANFNIDVTLDIPTACPSDYLISVTNTDRNDLRNTGAAYGATTIDLGAPGTTIYSCLPGNTYGSLTGTSMATPHVAGAVALMLSYACQQMISDYRAYPDSIARLLKQYMLESTDTLTDLLGETVSGGRLNIYKCLLAMQNYPCNVTSRSNEIPREMQFFEVRPNPASGQVEIFYNLSGQGDAFCDIYNVQGQKLRSLPLLHSDAGLHNHLIQIGDLPSGVYLLKLAQNGYFSNPLRLVHY